MDIIAKFSRCMKELLISKEKFGKLYNIISRTEEISLFIDELMQAIVDIFEKCNIPIGVSTDRQKDRKIISRKRIVVQCYNYLLLNTCFPSQQTLELDFLCGHGVNVWPNISPYLFIQIIWRLKYDEVLVESLQHIPLNLCVAILDVTIKCLIELENERAISLIFSLINRIYCKCLWLDWNVHIQLQYNMKEFLYQLVAHFQMLLELLDNFNQSSDCHSKIVIQKKNKQRGTFLKSILRHTRLCMCKKFSSNMINPDVTYKADMYRLTYGIVSDYTEIYVFSNYEINSIMIMLDRELVTLLLKQIQQIDHRECLDWAEIEDEEKPIISLQHAVAIECHNFMEYMKRDNFLVENDYLRQLLQQFINWSNFSSPENSNRFSLTLQKLRDRITNGKPKYMRKLMKRYKEWDISTLNFINDRMHLLGKDNIFFLLKFLHHVFANSLNVTERNQAYVSVLTVLQRVNVINLHLNVLKYTKQHFHDNYLECMYDDKVFDDFIKNGISMRDPLKLRVLLIYILLNAKKVLTILVKIVIGYVGYRSPDLFTFMSCDLLSLQHFLCMEVDGRYNLLLVILKEICFNNSDWHAKKLYNFISLMLRYQVIKIDELINYFYIPYLIMTDIEYNLYHIQVGLEFILTELDYAQKINYILLIVALTKKMSLIRENIECAKEETNEMLSIACEILYKFPKHLGTRRPALMQRKLYEYDYTIGNWLEPLDRTQMLMVIDGNMINVLHMIQNYETRCFPTHQKLRIHTRWKTRTNQIWKSIHRFTPCVRINRESLIRHMMLHATASEFKLFVYGLTELYYHFGWSSQLEAYENVVRIAIEAVQLTIVYCTTFPSNTFYTLLCTLIKFCKKFATRSDTNFHEAIYHILLEALLSLELLMNKTQYGKLYSSLLMDVSKMFANKCYENIEYYFRDVEEWIQIYFNKFDNLTIFFEENFESLISLYDTTNSQDSTNKLSIMYAEYCFICECIAQPSTETYGCIKYKFE